MTKKEMQAFRHQLLKLKRHFTRDVSTLEDEAFHTTDELAMGNLSNVPVEDRAERASDNYCEETTIGLVENADERLREINAALGRIDDEIFGTCEECAQQISIARLRAIPFARTCVKCARKAQQGEAAASGNL